MAPKFSLRKFLQTGHLGPIRPGMTMMEAAGELGPPTSWMLQPGEDLPTYWIYGHLEMLFALEAPHRLRWFQIEHADHLRGEGAFLGDRGFDLDLNGLHGLMSPSALLRARVWSAADVRVTIETEIGRNLTIGYHGVHVLFDLNNVGGEDEARLDQAIESGEVKQVMREYDRCARLDSIYSYPPEEMRPHPTIRRIHVDGARYLRLLR